MRRCRSCCRSLLPTIHAQAHSLLKNGDPLLKAVAILNYPQYTPFYISTSFSVALNWTDAFDRARVKCSIGSRVNCEYFARFGQRCQPLASGLPGSLHDLRPILHPTRELFDGTTSVPSIILPHSSRIQCHIDAFFGATSWLTEPPELRRKLLIWLKTNSKRESHWQDRTTIEVEESYKNYITQQTTFL